MRQLIAILSLICLIFGCFPSCTPVPEIHEGKDHYSTGIVDENNRNQERTTVPLGIPDAYFETQGEQAKDDAAAEDSSGTDTDCNPFHPDFPDC
jgi:hypothetical protein